MSFGFISKAKKRAISFRSTQDNLANPKSSAQLPTIETVPDLQPQSSPAYQQIKLDSNDSVRLLRIHHTRNGVGADDFACTLHAFSMATAPKFVALSYEWGSAAETRELHLDGYPMKIRGNLHDALHAIHKRLDDWELWLNLDHNDPVYFYVDALCIDQTNIPERNHQVFIMDRIYTQASLVLLWLGPAAWNSTSILEAAQWIEGDSWNHFFRKQWIEGDCRCHFLRQQWEDKHSQKTDHSASESLRLGFTEHKYQGMIHHDPRGLKAFDQHQTRFDRAWSHLLTRSYWNRLWILQEVLLAKTNSIMVLCGEVYIPWTALVNYLEFQLGDVHFSLTKDAAILSAHLDPLLGAYNDLEQPRLPPNQQSIGVPRKLSPGVVEALRRSRGVDLMSAKRTWNPKRAQLHRAVLRWSSRDCQDVRDKIFGLLGLVDTQHDRVGSLVLPDYSASASKLFGDLLNYLLRFEKDGPTTGEYFVSMEERTSYPTKLAAALQLDRNDPVVNAAFESWASRFPPIRSVEMRQSLPPLNTSYVQSRPRRVSLPALEMLQPLSTSRLDDLSMYKASE